MCQAKWDPHRWNCTTQSLQEWLLMDGHPARCSPPALKHLETPGATTASNGPAKHNLFREVRAVKQIENNHLQVWTSHQTPGNGLPKPSKRNTVWNCLGTSPLEILTHVETKDVTTHMTTENQTIYRYHHTATTHIATEYCPHLLNFSYSLPVLMPKCQSK